ncbi:MAG: hypothetical protein M9918_13345 [Anaerolineae bacterium]|nr:hypothetical protein [Anaerolineae bacterium]
MALISLLWKAAGHTERADTPHILRLTLGTAPQKNSYWLIKQNGDETITFTVVIEDVEITPITVANTSYSAQVLTMTWDSGGDVSAYVDGSGVGTPDAWPETYLVSRQISSISSKVVKHTT